MSNQQIPTANPVENCQLSDTSPAIEQMLIEGYRNMSAEKKLRRVFDLSLTLRELAKQRIIKQYGDGLSKEKLQLKLASLFLDRQTMIDAFQYDPTQEDF